MKDITPGVVTITHEDRQAINKEIAELLGYGPDDPFPFWSMSLTAAWLLHAHRPAGTILFDLAWLNLPQHEVAYEICKWFVYWTRRERGELIDKP